MGEMIGMDPGEARGMVGSLRTQAATLTALIGQIDGIVHQLSASWHGPEATNFVETWQQGYKDSLGAAEVALAGMALSVDTNATQQDNASGPGSLSIGGGFQPLGAGSQIGPIRNSGNAHEVAQLDSQIQAATAGKTPAQIVSWWNGLSAQQQRQYLQYVPATLVTLPGLGAAIAMYEGAPSAETETAVSVEGDAHFDLLGVPVVFKVGGEGQVEIVQENDGVTDVTFSGQLNREFGAALDGDGVSGDAGVQAANSISRTFEFSSPEAAHQFLGKVIDGTNGNPVEIVHNITSAINDKSLKVVSTQISGELGQTATLKVGGDGSPIGIQASETSGVSYTVDTTQHTQTIAYSVSGDASGNLNLAGIKAEGGVTVAYTTPLGHGTQQVTQVQISGQYSTLQTTGGDSLQTATGVGGTFQATIPLDSPANQAAASQLLHAIATHNSAAEQSALTSLYTNSKVVAQTQAISSIQSQQHYGGGDLSATTTESTTTTNELSTYVKPAGATTFTDVKPS
jgi:uncharacterized protein YukE